MSYTKIWLHCVWSTKHQDRQISKSFRPVLLSYFTEMCEEKGILLDCINTQKDHVHALITLGRKQSIEEIMQQLIGESAEWINSMKILPAGFDWHKEYFAVSVSESQVEKVRAYIQSQDKHHDKQTWENEVGIFVERYAFELVKD